MRIGLTSEFLTYQLKGFDVVEGRRWVSNFTQWRVGNFPNHVAFMSRGVAVRLWKSLELKGNRLQHAQHEKGLSILAKPLIYWCGRRDSNPHGKPPKGF